MNPDILTEKTMLRKKIMIQRRQVGEEKIREVSHTIVPRILDYIQQNILPYRDGAPTVMSYMSHGQEFPTLDLNRAVLEKGWRLVLPYTDHNYRIIACSTDTLKGLRRSRMGIKEPDPSVSAQITADETDVILLPGIAFDLNGNRLGYGKGCYDQFLSSSNGKRPLLVALAWSFQVIENVPTQGHDQSFDCMFTEEDFFSISDN